MKRSPENAIARKCRVQFKSGAKQDGGLLQEGSLLPLSSLGLKASLRKWILDSGGPQATVLLKSDFVGLATPQSTEVSRRP